MLRKGQTEQKAGISERAYCGWNKQYALLRYAAFRARDYGTGCETAVSHAEYGIISVPLSMPEEPQRRPV